MTSNKQRTALRERRATARLNQALEKKLLGYIAAASAAGVGMLTSAQIAEAKIVYTPTNVNITNGLGLDLNNDGITDFTFKYWRSTATSTFCPCTLAAIKPAQSGNRIWGKLESSNFGGSFPAASALISGVTIRQNNKLLPSNTDMCYIGAKNGFGYWWDAQNRYLGLQFTVAGQAHYGWARASFNGCSGVLTGYAYETVPNKPIKTGKTKGPDVITVESGTLGSLALGRK